jgi:hypothetical protein
LTPTLSPAHQGPANGPRGHFPPLPSPDSGRTHTCTLPPMRPRPTPTRVRRIDTSHSSGRAREASHTKPHRLPCEVAQSGRASEHRSGRVATWCGERCECRRGPAAWRRLRLCERCSGGICGRSSDGGGICMQEQRRWWDL